MKIRTVFDYIYYYVYCFVGKPKSQDAPHEMTSVFVFLTIMVHGVSFFIFVTTIMCINIPSDYGKLLIIIAGIFQVTFIYYYYIIKKNGERILIEYAGKVNERVRFVVGCLIFIEAFLFPFIFGILIIL